MEALPSTSPRRRRLVAALAATFAAVLLAIVPASAAQAARWHNISGNTFSNEAWHVSSNFRVKDGSGWVTAEFWNLINHGDLQFCVHNVACQFFDTTNNEELIAFVSGGDLFRNALQGHRDMRLRVRQPLRREAMVLDT